MAHPRAMAHRLKTTGLTRKQFKTLLELSVKESILIFDECPTEFKPIKYNRYVDDCFLAFKSMD